MVASGCTADAPPTQVIVVSLDTLRADRLGAWGNTRGLTPNLDRFAAESVIYEQAYAQANETIYSHASLFTSRYPSELGALDSTFTLPTDTATLAQVLQAYGWQTAAFVGGGQLGSSSGIGRGFGVYDEEADWGSLHDTAPRALNWLDTSAEDTPLLLFVHGYDAHDRYLKPTPFGYAFARADYEGIAAEAGRTPGSTSIIVDGRLPRDLALVEALTMSVTRFDGGRGLAGVAPRSDGKANADGLTAAVLTEADQTHLRDLYDGAVAYADASFGVLLAGLEARGRLDDAVVVVLSDHGEELGEEGAFHHRYALSDLTLHVPLLIRLPRGEHGGRRVTGLTELTDVLPTVLELVGAAPPAGIRGRSRVPSLRGAVATERRLAFSEGALRLVSARDATARLTASGLGVDNPAMADLIAATAVNGVTLLAAGDHAQVPLLKDALVAWRRSLRPASSVGDKSPDSAGIPALREHGYWEVNP